MSAAKQAAKTALKIGYVPEHFSTPLFFAKQHGFYEKNGVNVEFLPYPSGSGHLMQSLQDHTIDVAVGLTEAFIAGIGKGSDWFKLLGTYVQSPLCWAISTGAGRSELTSEQDVKGKTIGISRIGSGSYVMPYVLAYQNGWTEDYKFEVLQTFKNLRDSVNHKEGVEPSDAFMWEVFTTKKYYTNGELKQIGQIYTPWPSWIITGSNEAIANQSEQLAGFLKSVQEGIEYFNTHHDEAVEWISSNLDYSAEDAKAWIQTVTFSKDTSIVEDEIIKKTITILKSAEVLTDKADSAEYYVKV